METVHVDLGPSSYAIRIATGLLDHIREYLDQAEGWVVITDEVVDALYGSRLGQALGDTASRVVISQGEKAKNLKTVGGILGKMLDLGLTRRSAVIALGGGVVGDVAGFCASIYMRGIPFVQVPTTLLAQVDSSVGGKTGVNLPGGKNTVGSFYQPRGVLIDPDTLNTLPKRQLVSGVAEVIKYGVVYDHGFFGYLQEHFADLLRLDEKVVARVIKRCCEIKAEVVAKDEEEMGLRKILNCGHTVGHALETVTAYQQYTHGEAVMLGLYLETRMAEALGFADPSYGYEILTLLGKTGVNLTLDGDLVDELVGSMTADKKNRGGRISFVLPAGKGTTREVLLTVQEITELLRTMAK